MREMNNMAMTTSNPNDGFSAYSNARRQGRRHVAEMHSKGKSGYLPLLEEMNSTLSSEISLGVAEIPLDKVIGTYSAGRQSAFAGNFMPLLSVDTEFAGKWATVYNAHIGEGLRDPLHVYEYLGYYYVREGNKRVSVLKFANAYSYHANIFRLLPPKESVDEDIRIYYEILDGEYKKRLDHLWFSHFGSYTKLKTMANQSKAAQPAFPDRFFEDSYHDFRQAYHASGCTDLELTTGDAFLIYVSIYGFPVNLPEKELRANLRNCQPQFKLEALPGDPVPLIAKRTFPILSKAHKLTAIFAYRGTPNNDYSALMHDSARQIVQREFPLLTTQNVSVAEQCQSAYETLAPVMHTVKPDLLFSTDPHLMMVALRLSLEFHNTLIMQASPPFSRMHVSTYYGKTCEAAFLSGVLCGALSVTGKIGFVPGVSVIGATCEDMQAFAQGARTVRPLVEVYAYPQVEPNSENRSHAVETLGKMGCDYLLLPILPFSPLETKFFTGVFARVVCLSPGGQRQVASLAWHWDVFYRDILTNQTNDYPMHLNMGLRTGLVQVHPFANALNEWALRLFEHFRTLLRMDGFQAVDENMSVEICDVQLKEEQE